MVDYELLPNLSENLLGTLNNNNEYHDIIIEVGNDPNSDDGALVHIKLTDISPDNFDIILKYIYGGRLSLKEYDTSVIIKILVVASKLGLKELTPYLESFLIENKGNWMEQNFNIIYQTSFDDDSFSQLQKYCNDLISKDPSKIFNSPNFSTIPEKLLVSLIQNKNAQMRVVQIWEHVIKWGLAQNPELPSNTKEFTKDQFIALENTLKNIIPLIKFREMNSKEFSKKVKPFRKILSEDSFDDLLDYFLDSDNEKSEPSTSKEISETNIDSKIITLQQAELISKWIDKSDESTTSYKFKLLYRGSHETIDGFDAFKEFHEKCDNKSRTVTIIKVKNGNEIFGGYNPIEWKSNGYGITKDSFIFCFKNNNNIQSHVVDEKNAVYNSYYVGPSFGNCDLYLYHSIEGGLGFSCKKSSYEKQIRETEELCFVEEFEVFQIMLNLPILS
ncbi:carbohydrate-binding module family 13 protein [Rhizophagus irregularis DAOM 181602=DAOM 197198]|nr:carbohydrate-binding module family 13 protein [Rhizophagus irregularis DAOM 181602=DAOM 197198]